MNDEGRVGSIFLKIKIVSDLRCIQADNRWCAAPIRSWLPCCSTPTSDQRHDRPPSKQPVVGSNHLGGVARNRSQTGISVCQGKGSHGKGI